jgi:hypothetical protein
MELKTAEVGTELGQYQAATKTLTDTMQEHARQIHAGKMAFEGLQTTAASKAELQSWSIETNKSLRVIQDALDGSHNEVLTIGNYAEKYLPFYIQKGIQDAFNFLTGEDYKPRMGKYFPRVYRAIHHKILTTGGKHSITEDIAQVNKLFEQSRVEDIGVPVSAERYAQFEAQRRVLVQPDVPIADTNVQPAPEVPISSPVSVPVPVPTSTLAEPKPASRGEMRKAGAGAGEGLGKKGGKASSSMELNEEE